MSTPTKAPFKKLDQVFITRAGFPQPIGTAVTIASVVNQGTKRNPSWRFYGFGMWFNAEDVSATNPCA
jgi:hypothetical protein